MRLLQQELEDEIKQAVTVAKMKVKREVATNLLDVLPLETIVEVTGLRIEEVTELKKTNH